MSEIAKLRSKMTRKRNIINKVLLVEINEILVDENKSDSDKEIDLACRLDSLCEAAEIVRQLDNEIIELIEEEEEAEKDETEALKQSTKINAAIKKIVIPPTAKKCRIFWISK